jgi:hypothetical protein
MIVMIVVQTNIAPYCDQHLENVFILLNVEIFKCLHQQANNFFHRCANITWSSKGFRCPPLSIIHLFYRQRVSMALQIIQVATPLVLGCCGNQKGYF